MTAVTSQARPWVSHLAAVLKRNSLHLYRFGIHNSAATIHPIAIANQNLTCHAFSPDGLRLVVGTESTERFLFDTETNQCLGFFTNGDARLTTGVAFTPDDVGILTVTGQDVFLWSPINAASRKLFGNAGHSVKNIALGNGRAVFDNGCYTSLMEGDLRLFGDEEIYDAMLSQPHLTPDGSHLIGIKGGDAFIQNFEGWIFHGRPVLHIIASPNSQYVAAGTMGGDVVLYEIGTTWIKESLLQEHKSSIDAVGFSPDSRLILSMDYPWVVCVWDVRTRCLSNRFEVGFGPDYIGTLPPCIRVVADGRTDPVLPSATWTMAVDLARWTGKASVLGLDYTPPPFDVGIGGHRGLVFCKTRVACTPATMPCGKIHHEFTGPDREPFTISLIPCSSYDCADEPYSPKPNFVKDPTPPLNYHYHDGWITACNGTEAKRLVWLSKMWQRRAIVDLEFSGHRILLKLVGDKVVVLDALGLL